MLKSRLVLSHFNANQAGRGLAWIEEAVTIPLNGNCSNWEEKCDRELYHCIVHNNLKIIASLGGYSLTEALQSLC